MPLATTFAVTLGAMLLLWLLSLVLGNASIVDAYWGPGFAVIAAVALAMAPATNGARPLLAAVLVAIWGGRLGGYLLWRGWRADEDRRYAAMRRRHGERFGRVSLVTVFGLQALLMWFVSLPVQVAILSPEPGLGAPALLGFLLFAAGLVFESIGDFQLVAFKADAQNQSRVMDRGLWRYSRHPNYFGDALVWWGLYAIACAAPGGALTILSPVVMTVFLRWISGVTLLERDLQRRKPDYAAYVERTSALLPRPPRPG